MRRKLLIQLSFIAMLAVACSKGGVLDDGDGDDNHVVTPTDVVAPVIIISSPSAGQQFAAGTSVSVTGKITDDYGLYRGTIRITNDANGAVVKQQAYEIHGFLEYNFSLSQVISTAGDYTATVSFEDHGLNTASVSAKFKVNP